MLITNFITYFNGGQLPDEYWANLSAGAQPGEVKFFADIELNEAIKRHSLTLNIGNKILEAYFQKTLDTENPNEFFIASGMGVSDNDDIWTIVKAAAVIPFANDTPDDITGNGNNPAVSGDAISYESGMIGKAAVLNGANNLKFTQDLYGIAGFSVDIWFKASDLSGVDEKFIFTNSNNTDVWCKLLINADRDLILTVKTPGGAEYASAAIEGISEGDWHHIVLTYNTLDKFDVMHNGVAGVSLEIDPLDVYVPQSNTYIGSDDDEGDSGRFIGSIDEIRFYKDMVDLAHVHAEYNNKVDPLSFYSRVNLQS